MSRKRVGKVIPFPWGAVAPEQKRGMVAALDRLEDIVGGSDLPAAAKEEAWALVLDVVGFATAIGMRHARTRE